MLEALLPPHYTPKFSPMKIATGVFNTGLSDYFGKIPEGSCSQRGFRKSGRKTSTRGMANLKMNVALQSTLNTSKIGKSPFKYTFYALQTFPENLYLENFDIPKLAQ